MTAKKTSKKTSKPKEPNKPAATPSKFGVLGKDLSSKFNSRENRAMRPTTRGGRNGQGKP